MHTPMGYKVRKLSFKINSLFCYQIFFQKINKKDYDRPDGVLTVSSQNPLIIMPRDENNFSIEDDVDYIETWKVIY